MPYPFKPALIDYPINELAKNRWSPRVFSNQSIAPEKIMSLFEAARWAPSSRNEQPWRFVYAVKEDAENFARLSALLNEGNAWAKGSALLIVSFAKKNFTLKAQANYHALYDTGAAGLNLVLEAVNQGLMAHQMAGFDKNRAVTELGFNLEDYQAAAMIAVGYPATLVQQAKLTPEQQESELAARSRKKTAEIVFRGKF